MGQFNTEISAFAQQFGWNTKKERAAALVAGGRFTNAEMAAELHISSVTLSRWKKRPAFQARVEHHREIWRDRVMTTGIADQARRVEALDDRWARMKKVIEERAADSTMAAVPGGATGLLVRETKLSVGTGEFIDNFAFDCALLREMRATEEQASKELGQWIEKRDLTVKDCTWAELAREVAAEIVALPELPPART